jgi:hypothetical protein
MLDRLIAPLKEAEFFSDYWEKKSFHCSEGSLNRSKGFPTSECFHFGRLEPFIKTFGEGGGLVLKEAGRHLGEIINAFSNELHESFKAKAVETHLFFSPSGAKGVGATVESSEVFILQLEGCKKWKVEHSEKDYELKVGNILYIPRGLSHEACVSSVPSMHLSLGIRTFKYIDLLNLKSFLLSREESIFNSPLPSSPHFTSGSDKDKTVEIPEDLRENYESGISSLFDFTEISSVLEYFLCVRKGSSRPFFHGQKNIMDFLDEMSGDSVVWRREGIEYYVLQGEEKHEVNFHSQKLIFSDAEMEAFEFLMSGEKCSVKDIPSTLSDEAKLNLVKLLCEECLLTSEPRKRGRF